VQERRGSQDGELDDDPPHQQHAGSAGGELRTPITTPRSPGENGEGRTDDDGEGHAAQQGPPAFGRFGVL
jgi:hypothetical protein